MELICHKIFKAELLRLSQLSKIGPFAFSETKKSASYSFKLSGYDRELETVIDTLSGETLKTTHVMSRLSSQAPRYLMELLFTRAISALEVYLIDAITEIGNMSPETIRSADPISYSRNQILQFESIQELVNSLLEKDCRQLSSGGFREITKFYQHKLNIDYRSFGPGDSILEEYHTRRHLLVHKLGQTDEVYRHKYNSTAKALSVDKNYLEVMLADLSKFGESLNNKITLDLFGITGVTQPGKVRGTYIFEVVDAKPLSFLSPDFSIKASNKNVLSQLMSVVLIKNVIGKSVRLIIEADKAIVQSYTQTLLNHHSTGRIIIRYINPKRYQKYLKPGSKDILRMKAAQVKTTTKNKGSVV